MFPTRLVTIIIALLTASLAWYATTLPLGNLESDAISRDGAPHRVIKLSANQTASQSFTTTQPLLSKISVYSTSQALTNQHLTLTISNPLGEFLTSSAPVRSSYRDNKLKLTFPLKDWIVTNVGQSFVITITHQQGDPIELFTLTENTYAAGYFSHEQNPMPALDLALTTTQPIMLSTGTVQGTFAGIFFLIGALAISLIPRHKQTLSWVVAGLLLIIITPIALGGFWQSPELLGINDWDHNFSQHEILRQTLLTNRTLPSWNPYTCGGTAGLADPEFPLFTFTFLLELFFGIPIGFRLAIFLSTAVGAIGLLLLAKRIGLTVLAALVASLVAFFGSVNLLEIVEGHPNIFAAMWIPWIFWAWLSAYRSRRAGKHPVLTEKHRVLRRRGGPLLTGVFLALTFFQGGIYLLFYAAAAFLVLILLAPNHRAALRTTIKAGLWALGFASIKLIPGLLWLRQFQDDVYASSISTFPYLYEILLGRHLHGADVLPNQGTGWHEYGAYIGPLAIALAIFGLVKLRHRRLIQALLISVALATLLSSAGPALQPVFDQLSFIPRSTISRVILFAIIPLSLLAGIGLDHLGRWSKHSAIFIPSLVGLVAITLMSLAYPLSQQAFIIPADEDISPAPSPIAFTTNSYPLTIKNTDHTRSYLATKAGYGSLDYCSPLSPIPSIVTVEQTSQDSSIITVNPRRGSVDLLVWSPNSIQAKAKIIEATDVIINTNYAQGWFVNDNPAQNIAGRVGISLPPGSHDLTFRYRPPGFILGLIVTLSTLLLAAFITFQRFRK